MILNVIARGPVDPAQRAPVVLLHGLFGRARNLGFFQRRLAATHRTLAIDLRSHGESPHGAMDYGQMSSDVVETLAAHDALPAMLVGHSMGGKTAMTVALNYPGLVERLLVADIPPSITGHGSGGLARRMLELEFPATLDRKGADALLARHIEDDGVRMLMGQNLRLGEKPGWQIGLQEIVASMINIEGWPYVPEGYVYTGPTLFLAGENSPYIRPEHYQDMRRLFPNHRLEVVERAGHWLHVENPQRFAELLEGFVNEPPL